MASRSKFFYESSESSSDEQSITDEKPQKPVYRQRKTFEDDDEESEQKRLVRTEKDKRYTEMKALIHNISNGIKINDFGRIFDSFESLCKAFAKAKKVVDAEGIPSFFIAAISNLQDYVDECWERDDGSWKRSLDKGTSKYLSLLRQRIRKYNRDFEEAIKNFKEGGPEFSDKESADEEATDEKELEIPSIPPAMDFLRDSQKHIRFAKEEGAGASDDGNELEGDTSDDWGNASSDGESSSSSLDVDEHDTYLSFLKPEFRDGKEGLSKDRETAKGLRKRKKRDEAGRDEKIAEDEGGWEEVKDGLVQMVEKPKLFEKDEDVTYDTVLLKIHEILQSRGKRGFDSKERCDLLVELRQIARARSFGTGLDLYILLEMIGLALDRERNKPVVAGQFNYTTSSLQCDWTSALGFTTEIVDILTTHPEIRLCPELNDDEINTKERLDHQGMENMCRLQYLNLEHKYFRLRTDKMETHLDQINELVRFIYSRSSDNKLKLSAILLQAYSLSLHDCWYRARDLLLMPFVHDNIWYADVAVQILYNRALVQHGLCAFRKGLIKEAHSALADIHGNNKAKELLAQGVFVSRNVERNPDQERLDRLRLMPYHLHINIEVLECVYLICAMLIDVSAMSAPDFDVKRRSVSKQFYHQLRITEKQPCYGPPDNMREHIFATVRAMKFGNWKEAREMLVNPKMHSKVWRHIRNHKQVQEFVTTRIKEECLRIFIFNFSTAYDNIKLPNLAKDFELSDKQVKAIVSKMIYNREIMASLDQPTRCLVMHRTHPSTIQMQAIRLSDKATQLIDSNDKMSTFGGSVSRLLGDIPSSMHKLQAR